VVQILLTLIATYPKFPRPWPLSEVHLMESFVPDGRPEHPCPITRCWDNWIIIRFTLPELTCNAQIAHAGAMFNGQPITQSTFGPGAVQYNSRPVSAPQTQQQIRKPAPAPAPQQQSKYYFVMGKLFSRVLKFSGLLDQACFLLRQRWIFVGTW
jgi:hypothetical protein